MISVNAQIDEVGEMADKKNHETETGGKLKRKEYERELARLHIEFVKLQQWVVHKASRSALFSKGVTGPARGGRSRR